MLLALQNFDVQFVRVDCPTCVACEDLNAKFRTWNGCKNAPRIDVSFSKFSWAALRLSIWAAFAAMISVAWFFKQRYLSKSHLLATKRKLRAVFWSFPLTVSFRCPSHSLRSTSTYPDFDARNLFYYSATLPAYLLQVPIQQRPLLTAIHSQHHAPTVQPQHLAAPAQHLDLHPDTSSDIPRIRAF